MYLRKDRPGAGIWHCHITALFGASGIPQSSWMRPSGIWRSKRNYDIDTGEVYGPLENVPDGANYGSGR